MTNAAMSESERQEFLAAVHVGVVAIERADGPPLAVPMWYSYEPGGDISILIAPESLKARLLQAAARFSLCVQTETVPYRYVSVEGSVIETRACDVEADARVMARRYLGKAMGDEFVEEGDEASMVCVIMRPERWFSVDYGKAG